MAQAARIRIGTAGWSYRHWVGPFYPEGIGSGDQFAWYAGRFDTVEINNTFYRLPSVDTLVGWREAAPPDFTFACKASRYITHMKKLKDPVASTAKFFEAVSNLGEALGPVVFQLPPHWGANPDRLSAFLASLPDRPRCAFEFRDESWFSEEVLAILRTHGAALCLYDIAGRQSPVATTTDFAYVRLHGPDEEPYTGRYSDAALREWAARLRSWAADGIGSWCYFDNDAEGHAPNDALRLRAMVNA